MAPAGASTGEPEAGLPAIGRLGRRELAGASAGFLKRGAWSKADVLLVVAREGRFIVKDYGARSWPVRLAGAIQLAREERAYTALEGIRGIPRLGCRIDRNAIAVEYIEGMRLPKFHKYRPDPGLALRLQELLDRIHARGVIHNDIRSRDNILVTPGGTLCLIDFSSASIFREGAGRRLLMPFFMRNERRALLKWKSAIAPEHMTAEEWAIHRRFGLMRRLWPFNPKHDLEVKRARAARREGP
jgi:hypothetical protein